MPHFGDKYSQCADRFAIGKEKKCFAIADGVGNSLFPEDWARIVCNDFINCPDLFCNGNQLVRESKLIEEWNKCRDEKISNLTEEQKFLFELGLEKANFAACTFVGLIIDKKQWYCLALGDSYLFVLNQDFEILNSVASQRGDEFSNFPEYFASLQGKNNGEVLEEKGTLDNISYFVLLTDAISDWFLQVEKEKRKELISLKDIQSFKSLIDRERSTGKMKDDDTTAVIIEVVNNDDDEIVVKDVYNCDIEKIIEDEKKCVNELVDGNDILLLNNCKEDPDAVSPIIEVDIDALQEKIDDKQKWLDELIDNLVAISLKIKSFLSGNSEFCSRQENTNLNRINKQCEDNIKQIEKLKQIYYGTTNKNTDK